MMSEMNAIVETFEKMPLFDQILTISKEDIEFSFSGYKEIQWGEFLMNPRRLRGSDFLMRWSQGQWSEERLTHAVQATGKYFALPYGPSGTAPDHDPRAFELYFERLESAGLGRLKRPDLLVFRNRDLDSVNSLVSEIGGMQELPFRHEDDPQMVALLEKAIIAVECENSLWCAKKMPAMNTPLSPQKRLGGKLGLKKTDVAPTVILKDEDRKPLLSWQEKNRIVIHNLARIFRFVLRVATQ